MLSLNFKNTYINDHFSIASFEEEKGYIKNANMYIKNYYYGEKTSELAEIKMQKTVLNNLKERNQIDLIIGGDLSNQLAIMNTSLKNNNYSFLGLYNACSTFVESMLVGSMMVSGKYIKSFCSLTSSHVLNSEKQFRFPNEYGSLKKNYTTLTITASVGSIISNKKSKYKIICGTVGSVVSENIKDVFNIGAIMAPSAAKVISDHFYNFNKKTTDYDLILTGDLGSLGLDLLKYILKNDYGINNLNNILDAGTMIYKKEQNKYMGGSGPSVLPFVFFNKIIKSDKYKKILLVGTGALHNSTIVNEKMEIPSISHAIEIEVEG